MTKKNPSNEIIEIVQHPNTDSEANMNSISLLESSELNSDISQLKVSIKNYDESNEEITKEYHLDLTEVPPTPNLSAIQLEKEFLEELHKIILNQFDRIFSYEIYEKNISTSNLCDLKIRPDSLNQSILTPSLLSGRSRSIPLSEEIHETSYFSKDKRIDSLGTSNPLEISTAVGINNFLDLKNPKDKRIVSRRSIVSKLSILKSTEDKPILKYNLVPKTINYYPRLTMVDPQLTEISDNLSTIYSERRTSGWNPDELTDYHTVNRCHQPIMEVYKIYDYSQI